MLTGVRAAWFRLIEGEHLVATHAVGLSADFLRDAGFAEMSDDIQKLLDQPGAQITTREAPGPEPKECLKTEKIRQLVMVPVTGNKSPVGLLMLGSSVSRHWTPEELRFSAGLRQTTCGRSRKLPPAGAKSALAAAMDQYL